MCLGNNRFTDTGNGAAGCQCVDRQVHAVKSALCHRATFVGNFADQKRLALVAVPTVDDGRDVQIDNVAFLQDIVAGDPVADDLVDARAATFRIVLVPQRRGLVTIVDRPLVDHLVDFGRLDTHFDLGPDIVHQHGVDAAGASHRITLGIVKNQFSLLLQHAVHIPYRFGAGHARPPSLDSAVAIPTHRSCSYRTNRKVRHVEWKPPKDRFFDGRGIGSHVTIVSAHRSILRPLPRMRSAGKVASGCASRDKTGRIKGNRQIRKKPRRRGAVRTGDREGPHRRGLERHFRVRARVPSQLDF